MVTNLERYIYFLFILWYMNTATMIKNISDMYFCIGFVLFIVVVD